MKINVMTKEEKNRKDVVKFLDKKYPNTGYVLVFDDDSRPIIKLPRKLDMTFLNAVQKEVTRLIAERTAKGSE